MNQQRRATSAAVLDATAALARAIFDARRVGAEDPWREPGVRIGHDGIPRLDAAGATVPTEGRIDPEALGPAPDEAEGPRADAYRVGVVLYRALTGRLPLEASNPVEWRLVHRQQIAAAPSRVDPDLGHDFDRLLGELLAKDPARRPPTLPALAAELEAQASTPDLSLCPDPGTSRLSELMLGLPREGGVLPSGADVFPWAMVALGLVVGTGVLLRSLAPAPPVTAAPAPPPAVVAPPPAEPADAAPEPAAPVLQETRRAPEPEPVAAPAPSPEPRNPKTAPAVQTVAAAPVADPTRERRIDALLADAERLLARKRYLAPEGDNALARYREVLELDPDNREALEQVKVIRETYRELAEAHASAGDLDQSHDLLFALDRAMPGDAEVAARLLAIDARRLAATRPGRVQVRVAPWGDVFVDGRYVDQTPMPPLELAPGEHRVEVRGAGGASRSRRVRVESGQTIELSFDLSGRGPS